MIGVHKYRSANAGLRLNSFSQQAITFHPHDQISIKI